jgi:hypothetical protein
MFKTYEGLLETRGLDASDVYTTIQEALQVVDQTIKSGDHRDWELLTMCAACAVIWRQFYRISNGGENIEGNDGRLDSLERLQRRAALLLDQIASIPATSLDGHKGRAAVHLAWNLGSLLKEENIPYSRLDLALALDLLRADSVSGLGRHQDTLSVRTPAVSGRPRPLDGTIDEQVRQETVERSTQSLSSELAKVPIPANKANQDIPNAKNADGAPRRPFRKVCTPKEGAIISGIVAAIAVRLAESSPGCRPEVRSVSAAGEKHSRLDQAADVVVRCGSTARVILSVISDEELLNVVGCDNRRIAFQDIPTVCEIVEFNPFDLAVHVFRRSGQRWSLETLSALDEEIRLKGVDMNIPLREIYRFVLDESLDATGE